MPEKIFPSIFEISSYLNSNDRKATEVITNWNKTFHGVTMKKGSLYWSEGQIISRIGIFF